MYLQAIYTVYWVNEQYNYTCMKTILLSLLLTVLTTSPAAAWQEWTSTDRQLFVASSIAITADWATTRGAARGNWPNNTYETNHVMGRHPSVNTVDTYFAVMLISNYLIADYLPKEHRGMYLTIRTVVHGASAQRNTELGWRMHF